jgi:hypothetical protein
MPPCFLFAARLTHSLIISAIRESAKDKGRGTNDKDESLLTKPLPTIMGAVR